MEWLEQTKKISKMMDYIALDTLDAILKNMWVIEPRVLKKHENLISMLCEQYYKPNPIELIRSQKTVIEHFKLTHGIDFDTWVQKRVKNKKCTVVVTKELKACPISRMGVKTFSDYVDGSLTRCEKGRKDILWQWFEVIDFMYERPELIDPKLLDGYIEDKINEVCAGHRKNNPLTDGYRRRFGAFWKDKSGEWHPEKRQRF